MNEQTHKTTRNILLIAAGGALLVFLCASMAVAGFVVGQRTAQARTVTETVTEVVTRTVTEISEVTREVIMIATPETAVIAEPTPLPTPLPTAEPAPAPTAIPTVAPPPAETTELDPARWTSKSSTTCGKSLKANMTASCRRRTTCSTPPSAAR
jgi:hypothetical protein